MFHKSSSRLVILLNSFMPPYSCVIIIYITVCFKLINCLSDILLFFAPESSATFTSYTVQIIFIHLTWTLQPLQFRCFLLSNNFQQSSQSHASCCSGCFNILTNNFSRPINQHIIMQVFQSCRHSWDFNEILFHNFQITLASWDWHHCILWHKKSSLL
jgi:hypothetical protein